VAGRAIRVVILIGALLACLAPPAQAAFPGANGEIAFSWEEEDGETIQVCTSIGGGPHEFGCLTPIAGWGWSEDPAYSADGQRIVYWDSLTDSLLLVDHDGSNDQFVRSDASAPSWSPTARGKIVFADYAGGLGTINPDGTGYAPLTTDGSDFSPDWSPDGSQIAFTRTTDGNREIYLISPDSGEEVRLTNTPVAEESPDFSPDGSKILFSASGQLHTLNADGTDRTPLPLSGERPAWSPDGQKVTYQRDFEIYFASIDGTGETWVPPPLSADHSSWAPDWRPLPMNTASSHARPAGATPFRVPLVPAARECTTGNRTHAPPLAFPSCNPPVPESPNLTVGVGDGNPAPALSIGFVRLSVRPGVPGGVDDAEVVIRSRLSNVMRTSDLSEYPGALRAAVRVRLTDKEGTVSQTTQGFPLEWQMPCASTAATNEGSLCEATTTLDALIPGAAAEGTRANWALDQVEVYDGGPDEDAATTADNSLLATQGVFVP